jgi:hypothetical protein
MADHFELGLNDGLKDTIKYSPNKELRQAWKYISSKENPYRCHYIDCPWASPGPICWASRAGPSTPGPIYIITLYLETHFIKYKNNFYK